MKRLFAAVYMELMRAVLSYRFILSVLLPLCFYLASGAWEIYTLWNSSYTDVVHFAAFIGEAGSFSSMLVLAACFPTAGAYCDDVQYGYIRPLLLRLGERCYSFAKIISAAVIGGIATSGGLLVFILLLRFRFPLAISGMGVYDSFVMARSTNYWGELLFAGNVIGFFGAMLFSCFMYGTLWGCVGVVISGLIPNTFVALFVPYLTNILVTSIPFLSALEPGIILFGRFNVGGTVGSILASFGYALTVTAVSAIIFRFFVRGRLRNG